MRGTLWRANLSQAPCWRPGTDRVQGGQSPSVLLAAYPVLASQLLEYCMEREVRSSLQLLPGWPPGGRKPRLNPERRKGGAGKRRLGTDRIRRRADAGWRRLSAGLSGVVMAVAAPWRHIRSFETIASGNQESASPDDQYQPALSGTCVAGTLFTINRSFDERPDSRNHTGGHETFGNQCDEIRLVIGRGLSRRFSARNKSAWKGGAEGNELILYTD